MRGSEGENGRGHRARARERKSGELSSVARQPHPRTLALHSCTLRLAVNESFAFFLSSSPAYVGASHNVEFENISDACVIFTVL